MEELLKSVNNLNEEHKKQRQRTEEQSNEAVTCMDCESELPKVRAGIMDCVCKERSVYCPDCLEEADNCPKCNQPFSQLRNNLLTKRRIDTSRTKQKIIHVMAATSLTVQRYDSQTMIGLYQAQMFEFVETLRQNFKNRLHTEINLTIQRQLNDERPENDQDLKDIDHILKQFRGEGEQQGDFKTVMNSVNSFMERKRQQALQNNPQIIVVNTG